MDAQLHTHSAYSFMEGLAEPADLVRAAARLGYSALALTDHLTLTGAVDFYLACHKEGIKPLMGLEVDLTVQGALPAGLKRTGKLVLIAQDNNGWSNLCRMSSSLLGGENDEVISCTIDLLSAYSRGLICLTGGRSSLLHQWLHQGAEERAIHLLENLRECFGDRLYLEANRFTPEDELKLYEIKRVSRRVSIPVVATHPVYYLDHAQHILHQTLTAIRMNQPVSRIAVETFAAPGSILISPDELKARFLSIPEALHSIGEIVERCHVELPLNEPFYPSIDLPRGETASSFLRSKAEAGARRLYGQVDETLQKRLDGELKVIAERGYEPIFLIVEELISFARQSDIPTSSRGSAASSLVAHCLGITSPDPIDLNLYFERFLNPARVTPPDIDTDICSRRRDEIIAHAFEKYGADRVAMVGTINRFRSRSAIGDVAKAAGFLPPQVHALTRRLPYHFFHGVSKTDELAAMDEIIHSQHGFDPVRVQAVVEQAKQILDLPRHLSMHPGGLVVTPCPITDRVPVMRSGGKGVVITQFDLDSVEKLGLVKIDLLGIRGLTVLGDVAEAIQSWQRKKYRSRLQVLESIVENDPETAALIENGRTIGCFQIESPGMRAVLREIHAKSIPDIIAALALFRPGPLKGGLRDAYVRRHIGQERVEHLHPSLEAILAESNGVILYQEQVLRIAHELAGFDLAEADLLRRAMSHFDPGKQMIGLKKKFIQNTGERKNIDAELADRIWEMMASFAGYGFPKAHAASYAEIAWRSAWCKAHFPAEFMASVMANWGGYYSQRVYMVETRRLKLPIKPPHINHAGSQFHVVYPVGQPVLYMGLDQVKNLTRRTQERIMREGPFRSLSDFVTRVDPRPTEVESLIKIGGLDGLGKIPALLEQYKNGRWQRNQPSLFDMQNGIEDNEDWTLEQKVAAQEEVLGVSVDIHPLELFAQKLETAGASSTASAIEQVGKKVKLGAMRVSLRRSRTPKGETNAFLVFEDLEGTMEAFIPPAVYQRHRYVFTDHTYYFLEGTLEQWENRDEPVLRVEKAWPLR